MLAAKTVDISCVLLFELNRKDMEKVPAAAGEGVRFEFLKTVDEALLRALEPGSPNKCLCR
jgi:ATP-dependent Lon protease